MLLPASAWYLFLLIIPLAITVVFSFGRRASAGGYEPAFEIDNYAKIAERAGRLTDLGQVRLIACADPALATLISHDRKLRPLCTLLGDRHLAVPADREPDFRRALTALGYAVANGVSRRPG